MRFFDQLRFAFRGLRRQKARTLLTTLGVAVGACTLAFSISLGIGLRDFVDREFRERPGFWEVHVSPGIAPAPVAETEIPPQHTRVEGTFNAERMARLRYQLIQRYQQRHSPKAPAALNATTLAKIAAMPGVQDVITARWGQGHCYWHDKSAFVNVVAGRCDMPLFHERLLAGRVPNSEACECALSEMLLYDLGVRDEAAMAAAIGSTIRVELGGRRDELARTLESAALTEEERSTLKEILTKAPAKPVKEPATGTFTVVGIVRGPVASDEKVRSGYVFRWTTFYTGGPASEAMFRMLPHLEDGHYDNVEVKVKPGSDLIGTVNDIEAMGFNTQSAAEWFTTAKREVTLIGAGLNVFAIVSLVIAAMGITNTLVTSVVERTREIGMMKAIGATRGQIRKTFLIEGTLIGFLGGLVGLILARLLAGPADEFVRQQVQSMMRGNEMLSRNIFNFPLWLSMATPVFAALVTTLAALYPAHRASRITPIEALRFG